MNNVALRAIADRLPLRRSLQLFAHASTSCRLAARESWLRHPQLDRLLACLGIEDLECVRSARLAMRKVRAAFPGVVSEVEVSSVKCGGFHVRLVARVGDVDVEFSATSLPRALYQSATVKHGHKQLDLSVEHGVMTINFSTDTTFLPLAREEMVDMLRLARPFAPFTTDIHFVSVSAAYPDSELGLYQYESSTHHAIRAIIESEGFRFVPKIL